MERSLDGTEAEFKSIFPRSYIRIVKNTAIDVNGVNERLRINLNLSDTEYIWTKNKTENIWWLRNQIVLPFFKFLILVEIMRV